MDDQVLPISAVEFDPQNARVRTERSSYMIKESLQKFGPLRSLVGQRLPDGRIIVRAGNGTLEEAEQIGIDKVRVIERKPDELVVVVADDLDEKQWKSYSIADNRASDLSIFDESILIEVSQEVSLEPWFTEEEIAGWDGTDSPYIPDDLSEELDGFSDAADTMDAGSMQGLIIEFEHEDYSSALSIIKELRKRGVYVGGLVLEALRNA